MISRGWTLTHSVKTFDKTYTEEERPFCNLLEDKTPKKLTEAWIILKIFVSYVT